MNILTFDTLKYANTLKAAGFTSQQAEAQASVLLDVMENSHQELATKGDLLAVKNDIAMLEHRMDARFTQIDSRFTHLEHRMTIKLGSLMLATAGAVAAFIKLM
jgi:hypothetical protein